MKPTSQPRFWSIPASDLLRQLETTSFGLTEEEARRRLRTFGPNRLKPARKTDALTLFLSQFKSPIILILIIAAALSVFLREVTDAVIILAIVFFSGFLGFKQEKGASDITRKLLAVVQIKATVLRDKTPQEIPVEDVVPGDVVLFRAGDGIPADAFLLEARDLFIDEAALTGESYPVEKTPGTLPAETPLAKRSNVLFMGTHVVSGTAIAIVVHTAKQTEFGRISDRLKLRRPETEFEHGVRRFGYFLLELTLVLVIAIFAINVYFRRPVLDSFLFALALAVGLTPQLLPAIISINLAHGARTMAAVKVIVKRLASIENFGSMNILCADKTGTLTEGVVQIHSARGIDGLENENVLFYAYLGAFYETSFTNPIDEAIRNYRPFDLSGFKKLDEVPYDFARKRLSILVSKGDKSLIVTKGSFQNVLAVCSEAETSAGKILTITEERERLLRQEEEFNSQGCRTLGVAYRDMGSRSSITREDEVKMRLLGMIVLFDPIKPGIAETIARLKRLGISLKIITGDNQRVALSISRQVGFADARILTGPALQATSDDALVRRVDDVDVFAEVEPNQKERLIQALRKAGNVVGYMGDGINDAPALHAADVSISVDSAVDVAKEAADIILLEKGLDVLVQGVQNGRMTFANTLKYVFMSTSANFGNMFSMAGASLFLSFLPLLPKQILLMNFMTDFPEMAIASDRVDEEMIEEPRRWNIKYIRRFMMIFGSLSSIFDFLTFGVLLLLLHASQDQFRTGWFIESVVSAALVVLVIRTRRPFFKSRPGHYLLLMTLGIVAVTLVLPYARLAPLFGFKPPSVVLLGVLGGIVGLYVLAAETCKKLFYRRTKF